MGARLPSLPYRFCVPCCRSRDDKTEGVHRRREGGDFAAVSPPGLSYERGGSWKRSANIVNSVTEENDAFI